MSKAILKTGMIIYNKPHTSIGRLFIALKRENEEDHDELLLLLRNAEDNQRLAFERIVQEQAERTHDARQSEYGRGTS